MTPWTRRDTWIALLLAVTATTAVILAITAHPVGVFQDDGAYVVLAKALAQGDGYRYINMPNAPGATHFPPLYPLFLAALWKIGPDFPANVQFFKFVNAVLLGAAAAGAYVFARRMLGMREWSATITSVLACICIPLIGIARMVLSEPLFLAVLFPLLFFVQRQIDSDGPRPAFYAGLAAGALGLLRSLGMFLVPAIALAYLLRRRYREAVIALCAGVLVLAPWQVWTTMHADTLVAPVAGKYGSYSKWFVDGLREGGLGYLFTVFRENAEFSGTFMAGTFGLSTAPMFQRYALVAVVVALLAFGSRAVWRHSRVTTLFLAIYVPVVLVWPFPPDRFYWGVWPLLILTFVLGVRSLAHTRLVTGRWCQATLCAVVLLLGAMYARPQMLGIARPWIWDVQGTMADRSRAIVQWVNSNAAANDVIASEDDTMVYLYTGRLTLPLGAFTPREHVNPQTREFAAASVDTLLRQYPVRWLMPITWMGINASNDVARQFPTRVAFRQALPLGAVFERLPERGADQ